MKNRIASLFLVFALLMSLCVNAVARDNPITVQSGGAERFTDVPTSHWAYGYINKVVGSGLFNGKTPTTFEPSSAMTRSQFVLVMARMEGRKDLEGVETQTIFPDVAPTRLAAGPIQWANEQGFVLGFGDGTFKPDSPITRGQFAALIHRYITAKGYTNLNVVDPEPAQFTDAASVSTAFTADVEYARVHGLLTGYSDGTVRSGNPITRAAIAAILARFLDLVSESTDPATGQNYVPLLDYPRDSGNSGTTPVDAPSSYKEVNMKVSGDSHGATPTVSITRNGAAVAADDVKAGDRVTISHKPQAGYVATVRVRDANNRTVTVNRIDDDSSWFYMPSAMPVTVTVTYERESSGGGGGGGSSSGTVRPAAPTYWLTVTSTAKPAEGGWTYVVGSAPEDYKVPAKIATDKSATATASYYGASATDPVPGYAVFVAKDGYELKSVEDGDGKNRIADVKPATAYDVNGNELAISYIDLSAVGGNGQANAVQKSVTGTFALKDTGDSEDPKPSINLNVNVTKEFSSDVPNDKFTLADITVEPMSVTKVLPTQTVVITVPDNVRNAYSTETGYFRYQYDKVEVEYQGVKLAADKVTRDGDKVSFNVADLKAGEFTKEADDGKTIAVTVSYKVNADGDLKYTFENKLPGDGNGTVTVSASGVKGLEFTKAESKDATTTKLKYVEAYGKDKAEGDNPAWDIPFTVSASPAANSKMESLSVSGGTKNEKEDNGSYTVTLDNGGKAEINAEFKKNDPARGYKLTVVGAGTSTPKLDGVKQTSADATKTMQATVTYGPVIGAKNNLTLENYPAKDWKLDSVKVDGKAFTGTEITLKDNAVTDITVAFRKTDAVPVTFKVTSAGGTTNIQAENGRILKKETTGDPSAKDWADAKRALVGDETHEPTAPDDGKGTVTPANGETTYTYYAMSGTMITLTGETGKKIKEVKLTGDSGVKDVSGKAGYSFILAEIEKTDVAQAKVTFGELDSYALLAAAPITKPENYVYAKSTSINTEATIDNVLKSLNDNGMNSSTKIENVFQPDLLGSVVYAYLQIPNARKNMEDKLNESVADTLKKELPSIVKDIKDDKLSGLDDTVKQNLSDKLDDLGVKESDLQFYDIPVAPGYTKSSADFMRKVFDRADGFSGKDPAGYRMMANFAIQLQTGDNNVQQQMLNALHDYVGKIDVDASAITPKISVTATDYASMTKTPATITISATVEGKPTLSYNDDPNDDPIPMFATDNDTTKYFALPADFGIWVTVTADIYQGDTKVGAYSGSMEFDEVKELLSELAKANGREDKTAAVDASKIAEALTNDETGVDAKFKEEWKAATDNLTVDMSSALKEQTLNDVVGTLLEKAINSLANRVKSLKDSGAQQTKTEFKNLYNKLVVFKGDVAQKDEKTGEYKATNGVYPAYLELKATGGNVTLGTIQGKGDLVLTLDLDKFLNDMSDGNINDNTVYEAFIDQLIALRTGFASDLQSANTTAEAVIADILTNHFGNRLEVTKWGTTYGGDEGLALTNEERREAAELVAKLVMSKLTDKVDEIWTADDSFESHGYNAVTFSTGVKSNSSTDSTKGELYKALHDGLKLSDDEIKVGFQLEQVLK